MKIRVGIDVDGVLRDFVGQTMKVAKEGGLDVSRPLNYDYIDDWVIDGKTMRSIIWGSDESMRMIFEEADVIPFARKGYERFCNDEDFEVHIVTAQRKGTEQFTENWLKENGFDKHINTFYEIEKLKAPVQVLIDDKPSNVEEYADNLRDGYLVTCSYNQDCSFKPRVDNLNEAYEKLSKRYDGIK